MKRHDAAWLAGFIDGEGCFGVYRNRSKHQRFEYDFGIRVVVVNTNLEAIQHIHKLVGAGCVYVYKKAGSPNWKPCHRFQIVGNAARRVIADIRPFLRIKGGIADLVLTLPVNSKQGRTAEQYQAQMSVYEQARVMNQRGAIPRRTA